MATEPVLTFDTDAPVRCDCPPIGTSPTCPWGRDGLGHVKACPVSGDPCPCLPGSLAHAYCGIESTKGRLAS